MMTSRELDFNYELGQINEDPEALAELSEEDDHLPDFRDKGPNGQND